MILRHKKTKRLYNFIGLSSEDRISWTLSLELWFRDKDGKIKHAKRSFNYSSFERIKEMLKGFEELVSLENLNKRNFQFYEEHGDDYKSK